jgi:hypothetical protein
MVSCQVHWPLEEGEDLNAYVLRMVAGDNAVASSPSRHDAAALEVAKQLLRDKASEPIIVTLN